MLIFLSRETFPNESTFNYSDLAFIFSCRSLVECLPFKNSFISLFRTIYDTFCGNFHIFYVQFNFEVDLQGGLRFISLLFLFPPNFSPSPRQRSQTHIIQLHPTRYQGVCCSCYVLARRIPRDRRVTVPGQTCSSFLSPFFLLFAPVRK